MVTAIMEVNGKAIGLNDMHGALAIVGWSMRSRMTTPLVCDALMMAIWRRQPAAGLIHHSDRGSQYASHAFRKLLKGYQFTGSMSRKGNCWDNTVAESFFGSLKQERVQWRNYQSRHAAHHDVLTSPDRHHQCITTLCITTASG